MHVRIHVGDPRFSLSRRFFIYNRTKSQTPITQKAASRRKLVQRITAQLQIADKASQAGCFDAIEILRITSLKRDEFLI